MSSFGLAPHSAGRFRVGRLPAARPLFREHFHRRQAEMSLGVVSSDVTSRSGVVRHGPRIAGGSPQDPYRRVALITSVLIDVGKQVANRNAKGACEIVDPLEGDAAAPVFDLDQIVPAHPCFQRQTLLRQIFSQPKRPDLTADRLSIQRPPLVAVGIICGCWRCRHQTSDCEWRLKVCTVDAT